MFFFNVFYVLLVCKHQINKIMFFFIFFTQRCIPCHFLDVANTMVEITDFCPKLRILSILITDFSFQRLASLHFRLATVMSSNPFNIVNAHCYELMSSVKNVH